MIWWLFLFSFQLWAQDPLAYLYAKKDWGSIYLQLQMSRRQSQRSHFRQLEDLSTLSETTWTQKTKILALEKELKLFSAYQLSSREQELASECLRQVKSSESISSLEILAQNLALPSNCRRELKERLLDLSYAMSEK